MEFQKFSTYSNSFNWNSINLTVLSRYKKSKQIITSEQLKTIICETIRQEMKRTQNPFLSTQRKYRPHERHGEMANHLIQDCFIFGKNIFNKIHQMTFQMVQMTLKKLHQKYHAIQDTDERQRKQRDIKHQVNLIFFPVAESIVLFLFLLNYLFQKINTYELLIQNVYKIRYQKCQYLSFHILYFEYKRKRLFMTDLKESKRKKILRNIDSFYSMLQKNEDERIAKPQKTNRTSNPRQKPEQMNLFDKPSHDYTNRSEKNINYQYCTNQCYGNKPRNDRNQSMINSTLNKDQPSNNQKLRKNLNNTKENNGQQHPIIEQKSYEKLLKNFQTENQKSKTFMKKQYQFSQVDDYKKKVPTNFNPLKQEFQGTDQQDDQDISEILNKIQSSQIGTQQVEQYFPEIKHLRDIYTSEQLKEIICDTIREEIKRAKNPLLSSQEKSKLNERHRDLANNLNKHHLVFNQNIIHKNGQNSASNRKNPSYDEFSFGDQNYHKNPLRSSKPASQKLYQQVINLRDNDPKQFKQLNQKIQANSKTQKDKKISHNLKAKLGSIATLGGIAIKVARDVKSHYQEPSSSIQSNIMSCGKAMIGGAFGKILGEKINPKLKNPGALIEVLAASDRANKRMGKILQKTGKYLHKFAQTKIKQEHSNEKSPQHHLYQEFFLYENQQQGKN